MKEINNLIPNSLVTKQIQKWAQNKPMLPIFGILIIIASVIGYLALRPYKYSIVETTPKADQNNLPIATNIVLTFNQSIPESTPISITLTPFTEGQISYISDYSQVVFNPTSFLSPDTRYHVSISGKGIKPYSFSFNTNPVPSSFSDVFVNHEEVLPTLPPNATQDQILDAKLKLISTLPYSTDLFELSYVVATDRFIIEPKGTRLQEGETAGLNYIKSFGFSDPYKQLKVSLFSPLLFLPQGAPTIIPQTATASPSASP